MTSDEEDARAIAASILAQASAISTPITSQARPSYIYEAVNEKTGDIKVCIDFPQYSNYLANHLSIIYFNKTLHIYDSGECLYRTQTNEIETHIRNTCVQWRVTARLPSVIIEMMSHLTSMGCSPEYPFNCSTDTIPAENGIIKINYDDGTINLLPHGPTHLFTYKLQVKYKPEIRNCYVIPLLKRMVEPGNIKTLVQIPAQALLQMQTGHAYKKAYLLQGEPHAGKTSYLKLLYAIFGDDFTTAISLQHLCTDRFAGGCLEGKLLNIYDDLEDVALEVIDQFKTLTGDCRHGIERKYEPKYTGKVTAVHIFTCNYPPEYPEKVKRDAAFWTRWEYVKFPYEYGVNPNFYTEWYTEERLSSFLNLILSTMITIKKRGLISNSDIQEVMLNWSTNSDPMFDFLSSVFEPAKAKKMEYFSKTKLHNLYIKWCEDNGIPEHKRKNTLKSFTIALQSHNFTPDRKREQGNNYEVFGTSTHIIKTGILATTDLDYHAKLS
jgi:phage/plasmid-associated DNA primase